MISARLVRQRRACTRRKTLLAQDELSGLRDAQPIILSAVLENDLAPALHQLAHEVTRYLVSELRFSAASVPPVATGAGISILSDTSFSHRP